MSGAQFPADARDTRTGAAEPEEQKSARKFRLTPFTPFPSALLLGNCLIPGTKIPCMEMIMNGRIYPCFAVLVALLAVAAGCASARYPFLTPEDVALKEKVQAEVALYSDVVEVSAVNGRIYLSGNCVETYGLVEKIVENVRRIDGVREVYDDVKYCDRDRWDDLFN